jgi:hypothetical protein
VSTNYFSSALIGSRLLPLSQDLFVPVPSISEDCVEPHSRRDQRLPPCITIHAPLFLVDCTMDTYQSATVSILTYISPLHIPALCIVTKCDNDLLELAMAEPIASHAKFSNTWLSTLSFPSQ